MPKRERFQPLQIYQLLPGTNCKLCGCPGCVAFAFALISREKRPQDCPDLLAEPYRQTLELLNQHFGGEAEVGVTGLIIHKEKCNGCGDCVVLCAEAITAVADHMVGVDYRQIDEEAPPVLRVVDGVVKVITWGGCKRCAEPPTACRICEEKCPFGALELVR